MKNDAKKNETTPSQSKLSDGLSCTRCGERQGTYSEITYSQGDRVCFPCAEKTKEADKRAFDRDMSFRR
jgi:formylmethanofuran dehydrogenase subunit E